MRKDEARKLALSLRKQIDNKAISKIVVDDILSSKVLDKYSNIGIYYPIGKEIDIMDIMNYYPNKKFFLPITRDEISFIEYKKDDKLVDGMFNTKEPIGEIISRDNIECFIIPCVVISKDNMRVGYGKGYYDRYLKDYKGLKIGIAYKDASNLDIEMDLFDLTLDKIFLG